MNGPFQGVVTLLEDVVYPRGHYAERACRAGAELLRQLLDVDVLDALSAYYVPGAEELAVRAALEEGFKSIDGRLVAKAAAAMSAHAPRLAPYEDAEEVFSMRQGMGMKLGLVADGPAASQRQMVKHLKIGGIFDQVVYSGELRGDRPLADAIDMMELLLDCPLRNVAFVCSKAAQAKLASGKVGRTFRVFRNAPTGNRQTGGLEYSAVIPMLNLYDLPEALGLVAWPD